MLFFPSIHTDTYCFLVSDYTLGLLLISFFSFLSAMTREDIALPNTNENKAAAHTSPNSAKPSESNRMSCDDAPSCLKTTSTATPTVEHSPSTRQDQTLTNSDNVTHNNNNNNTTTTTTDTTTNTKEDAAEGVSSECYEVDTQHASQAPSNPAAHTPSLTSPAVVDEASIQREVLFLKAFTARYHGHCQSLLSAIRSLDQNTVCMQNCIYACVRVRACVRIYIYICVCVCLYLYVCMYLDLCGDLRLAVNSCMYT